MKNIDEIAKMSPETLEREAGNAGIMVPDNLVDRIQDAVIASELTGADDRKVRSQRATWWAGSVAAAAAVALVVMLTDPSSREPQDTFSDPYLAYAQLEQTFEFISSKISDGLEIASEVEPALALTEKMINGKK